MSARVAPGGAGPVVAIVDYGMGNRRSVEKALARAGARPVVSSEARVLETADGLVLPGVGAFPRAMENLAELRLGGLLRERVAAGTPVLGVCLGMQLAFDGSEELGGAEGLGIVPGRVTALKTGGLKLPHIGWTEVETETAGGDALFDGLGPRTAFYHVHSFAARPSEERDAIGVAEYGERFVTAVSHGSFAGVQFHPEKSSSAGLRLLANFTAVCARAAARQEAARTP